MLHIETDRNGITTVASDFGTFSIAGTFELCGAIRSYTAMDIPATNERGVACTLHLVFDPVHPFEGTIMRSDGQLLALYEDACHTLWWWASCDV